MLVTRDPLRAKWLCGTSRCSFSTSHRLLRAKCDVTKLSEARLETRMRSQTRHAARLCMAAATLFTISVLPCVLGLAQQAATPAFTPFACGNLEPAGPQQNAVRVTFIGVGTLLFDDGETAFLTDGFFTRPDMFSVALGKIGPNIEIIKSSLQRAGVSRLAAVIPLHSHYDHAMDAPEVAKITGAVLHGSESTANIARGSRLPESQIKVIRDGDRLTFGRFEITVILSRHTLSEPLDDNDRIKYPVTPPTCGCEYKTGETFKLLVRHNGRTILVGSSAGWIPDQFKTVQADVVFLGIATPALDRPGMREEYWNQVVKATRARRVIPIHWDLFFGPLEQEPAPLPYVWREMLDLTVRATLAGVDLKCARPWEKVDPFADLSLSAR